MTNLTTTNTAGQVFIPEELNEADKAYLEGVSSEIVTTIQRAAVRVGFYLLEVKERFKENGQFSGNNGWFEKWYKSLGFNSHTLRTCINAAELTVKHPDLKHGVELLSERVLTELSQPSLYGGASLSLQREVLLNAINGTPISGNKVRELKRDPEHRLDSLSDYRSTVTASLDTDEELDRRARWELNDSLNRIDSAIEQTLDKATAPTAETPSKREASLEVANQEAIEAKKEALELKQEVEALRHQVELANKAKEDAEREKRSALRDKKDITERFNDLHQQHQNPVDAKLILTGIHMRFIEMEKDANSYSIIEPGYQPRQYIKNCEACFVAMVEAWLPIIAEENFDAVVTAVEKLKRSAPEPLDYIDATVVTD